MGPAATLTMSTAAETAATMTIQLSRSSSSAIQMPSAAAKTTLATFAAGTQPIQTKSTAHGRAARATSGSRRPSALSGSMAQTSAATAVSTIAADTMMSARTGMAGSQPAAPAPPEQDRDGDGGKQKASHVVVPGRPAGGRAARAGAPGVAVRLTRLSTAGCCRTTPRAGGRRARSRP